MNKKGFFQKNFLQEELFNGKKSTKNFNRLDFFSNKFICNFTKENHVNRDPLKPRNSVFQVKMESSNKILCPGFTNRRKDYRENLNTPLKKVKISAFLSRNAEVSVKTKSLENTSLETQSSVLPSSNTTNKLNMDSNLFFESNNFLKLPNKIQEEKAKILLQYEKKTKKPITLKEAFKIFSPQEKKTTSNNKKFAEKNFMSERKKTEYKLETFQRSNQDTCLTHKPAVFEGDWVQSGDFLTDCANSVGGELSLGQNIFIAYMPWEGYNFEDAILISERLVSDDVFTSVHIERYEIENLQKNGISQQERLTNKEITEKRKTKSKDKKGNKTTYDSQTSPTKKGKAQISQTRTTRHEEITRDIPDVSPEEISHLDSFGIVKIGSFIEEGDILVGKITPINKKEFTPYQKLLYTILDKQIRPYRDSSLRAPKGIKAKVMDIKIFVKPGSVVRSPSAISPYSSKFNIKNSSKSTRGQVGSSSLLQQNKTRKKESKKILKREELSLEKKKFFPNFSLKKISSPTPSQQKQKNSFPEFPKRKMFGTGFSSLNVRNLNKNFLKTNKMRNILLQGLKPQHSLYSILGADAYSVPLDIVKGEESRLPSRGLPPLLRGGNLRNQDGFVTNQTNLVSAQDRSLNVLMEREDKRKNFQGFENSKPDENFSEKFSLYHSPLKASTRENFEENISPSQFSQLSSYGKNFSKGPRVIRTLQSIINGQVKNQKIMKKLKKELNKDYRVAQPKNFFSTKSIKDIETIHIYLAEKRKIQVGDKMSGRHGNKGIVSQILPMQDMPFLPDGTPIDMVLNPLGVPSRMNVGQIYECLLGLAGKYLGEHYKISSFDEIYGPDASRSFVFSKLYEARRKTGFKWLFNPQYPGKIRIYDGRTGDCYHQPVTVGQAYMLRLVHMVDDKIHMRSTGPYSLVTQQPLRGRSKQGGQRLGEMEVWALEGYGAAFTLLEMLTVKSDDLTGRMTLWSNLILNKDLTIGTPEAFKVLICELQALCLDIGLFRYNTTNSTTSPLGEDSVRDESNRSVLDSSGEKSNFLKGPQQKKSLTEITSLMSFP